MEATAKSFHAVTRHNNSGINNKTKPQRPTLGFGVPATTDPHHFVVLIPRVNSGAVEIIENLGIEATTSGNSLIRRVVLDRPRWTAIRGEVQRAFNSRMKEHNLKSYAWKVGENPVDRLLGKELCVLAWAVEKMDEENIPVAVRNWLSLRPEERWWLFGMTALSTGKVNDSDIGWRLALRHALGDVAIHDLYKPQSTGNKAGKPKSKPVALVLFGNQEKK